MSETGNSVYDKLTPQRKQLVDEVIKNLESGEGLWRPGWEMLEAPESGITGKKYRGVNNFFLTLISMSEGYTDNRWVTFKQMESKDWHFKTDEEGKSVGKGKGVSVEFFELRDNKTKQRFDRHTLDGMSEDEKQDYFRDNVKPIRKFYRVFNADLIDGIPEKEKREFNPDGEVERADKIIDYWSKNEAKIIYGGSHAYYNVAKDEIRVPERTKFYNLQEFYSTVLHEIGHSTGHEKRLNREIRNTFGSAEYAVEELRAEIASMFMQQDLEIPLGENHIQNNSAYIKNWHDEIKENPNALFTAIADADKIAKFVAAKEKNNKKVEHFAIVQSENAYGETVYQVHMANEFGQTAPAISYGFASREALMQEFEKMQTLPLWADSEFKEVNLEELKVISMEKAEENQVTEEPSSEYAKPSEVAARTVKENKPVDMSTRGIESLSKMGDKDVVERAGKTKNGDKFNQLYNGISVLGNEEKDERSLMARLAMFCGNDKEQLLRVFQSSGQFRDGKGAEYYSKMAEQSMQFIARIKSESNQPKGQASAKGHFGANAKR